MVSLQTYLFIVLIYCINLLSAKDRRLKCNEQLQLVNSLDNLTYIDAVDKQTLTRPNIENNISEGELACCLSHIKALTQFIEEVGNWYIWGMC